MNKLCRAVRPRGKKSTSLKFTCVLGMGLALAAMTGCRDENRTRRNMEPELSSKLPDLESTPLGEQIKDQPALRVETGSPTPGITPIVTPFDADAEGATKNLIADPEFKDLKKNWIVQFLPESPQNEVEVEQVTLPNGRKVNGLRITTDQNAELKPRNPTPASPESRYRISLWVRHDAVRAGQRFFGFYAHDGMGAQIVSYNAEGKPTPKNQHFSILDNKNAGWREASGILLPNSAGAADFNLPARPGLGRAYRLSMQTKSINMFFLNYYNKGAKVTTWVALPSITEVE